MSVLSVFGQKGVERFAVRPKLSPTPFAALYGKTRLLLQTGFVLRGGDLNLLTSGL